MDLIQGGGGGMKGRGVRPEGRDAGMGRGVGRGAGKIVGRVGRGRWIEEENVRRGGDGWSLSGRIRGRGKGGCAMVEGVEEGMCTGQRQRWGWWGEEMKEEVKRGEE